MNRKLNLLLLIVALCSFSALQAATLTFTGGGDGTSWEDPANWDLGVVPGFSDRAIINGTSSVTLSSVASLNSFRVTDDGVLTIMTTGTLIVNELDPMNDAVRVRSDGLVTVNGSLVVINSRRNGIEIRNRGRLVNNGFVNVVSARFEGIYMFNNATLVNNNTLFVQGSDELDCLDMEDNAAFYNYGTASLSDPGEEIVDMDDNSQIINEGTLNLSGADDWDALDMDDSGSFFSNSGALNISNVLNRGEGIEIDDGTFHNESTGTVNMFNVTGDALNVESGGIFINNGTLSIGAVPGDNDDNAIEIESSGFLENNNIINISLSGPEDADAIELEYGNSDLDNTTCGVINILTNHRIDIESGGDLYNVGVIATVFNGTNTNDGTLESIGEIIAPAGFMIAPNAVVGGGTITTQGNIPATSDCDLNIGAIGCGGTTVYDAGADTYTQTAQGCLYGPNYMSDNLSYAFRSMCGNGEIIARVASFTGAGWAGVAMRETASAGSKKVQLLANPPYALARREVRVSTNGPAFPQQFPIYTNPWLRIQRIGHSFRMYVSQNGYSWQFIGMSNVYMSDCIEVGVVSTNFNVNSSSTAVFDNVFITAAAPLAAEVDNVDEIHVDFETTEEESINVYPNPTSGKINIEVNSQRDELMEIQVINALGQPVKSLSLNPTETFREEVDLSGLPTGMYYVQFQKADGETHVERVLLNVNK